MKKALPFVTSVVSLVAELTRTMTRKTVVHPTASYEEFVHAQRASHVTRLTVRLTLLYHGVFHIRETATITGRGCTVDWSGTGTSVQPSQILSPWESRSAGVFTIQLEQRNS